MSTGVENRFLLPLLKIPHHQCMSKVGSEWAWVALPALFTLCVGVGCFGLGRRSKDGGGGWLVCLIGHTVCLHDCVYHPRGVVRLWWLSIWLLGAWVYGCPGLWWLRVWYTGHFNSGWQGVRVLLSRALVAQSMVYWPLQDGRVCVYCCPGLWWLRVWYTGHFRMAGCACIVVQGFGGSEYGILATSGWQGVRVLLSRALVAQSTVYWPLQESCKGVWAWSKSSVQ